MVKKLRNGCRLSGFSLLILFACVLSGCHSTQTWHQVMTRKMAYLVPRSKQALSSPLRRAGLHYPPSELALLIFKRSHRLELYARGPRKPWSYIKRYYVYGESGGLGPKLHRGDLQVPEGVYALIGLNPLSQFDLSMHVNYPNAFDQEQAAWDGRRHLGGDIYIHGSRQSVGCIAIGNASIEELFPLVAKTGIRHVKVIIAPNDFRVEPPHYGRVHPPWLDSLYKKIKLALQPYPLSGSRA